MKTKHLITAAVISSLFAFGPSSFAAEKEKAAGSNPADAAFVAKAADGGMTEVELGKIAEKNGEKEDIKSFGKQMVEDHGKANDKLKSVASKLKIPVPGSVSAKHQAQIDKMSKIKGAEFDKAYAAAMVKDHEKDISEFEAADKKIDESLKEFIGETVPVMKHHLEMAKKLNGKE